MVILRTLNCTQLLIMNVSLTPYFDKFIKSKVESGQYHSASEVVRAALRLLEEREAVYLSRNDAIKKELQEGLDSGAAEEWNKKDFLEKARKQSGLREK